MPCKAAIVLHREAMPYKIKSDSAFATYQKVRTVQPGVILLYCKKTVKENSMAELQGILEEMMGKGQVAFLSSVGQDGCPKTRAMLMPCTGEDARTLIFHTNTSSQKVAQFKNNPKASVYVCLPDCYKGLLLAGDVEVLENEETKSRYWKENYKMYYKEGVNDADYCILRFTAQTAEYYHDLHVEYFDSPNKIQNVD